MNSGISVDNAEDRSQKYMTELLHSTQMKYLIHRYNSVIMFVLELNAFGHSYASSTNTQA